MKNSSCSVWNPLIKWVVLDHGLYDVELYSFIRDGRNIFYIKEEMAMQRSTETDDEYVSRKLHSYIYILNPKINIT